MSSPYKIAIYAEVKATSAEEAARLALIKIMNAPVIDVGVDCPDGSFITLGIGEDPREPAVPVDVS